MQMDHTKVFLRRRVFEALEFLRNVKLGLSPIVIQSHVRQLLAQLYLYDSLTAKQMHMVRYLFQLAYDLCIDSVANVSLNPGFETCLGVW